MPEPTLEQVAGALLACLEGCRLTAYQDPGGLWTIGIGHRGPEVVRGLTISYDQAMLLFADDQAPLLTLVKARTPPSTPVTHQAAYVSFGFNVGRTALSKVLLGQDTISNPIHTHDRYGNVDAGLVSRRRLEQMLLNL